MRIMNRRKMIMTIKIKAIRMMTKKLKTTQLLNRDREKRNRGEQPKKKLRISLLKERRMWKRTKEVCKWQT